MYGYENGLIKLVLFIKLQEVQEHSLVLVVVKVRMRIMLDLSKFIHFTC